MRVHEDDDGEDDDGEDDDDSEDGESEDDDNEDDCVDDIWVLKGSVIEKNTYLFCWCQIVTNCARIPKM